MPKTNRKWTLSHGIHRGTITSRDSTTSEHMTLAECRKSLDESEEFYKSIGYRIWFAKAVGPDGQEHRLSKDDSNYAR